MDGIQEKAVSCGQLFLGLGSSLAEMLPSHTFGHKSLCSPSSRKSHSNHALLPEAQPHGEDALMALSPR